MEKRIYILILSVIILSFTLSLSAQKPEGEEKLLSIYPNPAKDNLKVELQSEMIGTPEIHIIDLTGKTVKKFEHKLLFEHNSYKANLDISELKTGIYFLKVIQPGKVYSGKLIVK